MVRAPPHLHLHLLCLLRQKASPFGLGEGGRFPPLCSTIQLRAPPSIYSFVRRLKPGAVCGYVLWLSDAPPPALSTTGTSCTPTLTRPDPTRPLPPPWFDTREWCPVSSPPVPSRPVLTCPPSFPFPARSPSPPRSRPRLAGTTSASTSSTCGKCPTTSRGWSARGP